MLIIVIVMYCNSISDITCIICVLCKILIASSVI